MKKSNRLVAGIASVVLAVAAALGIGLTTASTAEAQTVHTYYDVNTWGVCQHQGHTGAGFYWQFNPYSLFCFDGSISYPLSVSAGFAGGLDIEDWCRTYHSGSHAALYGNSVYDWKCVITTTV